MAATGLQFTILERIIKRFASEFVQDINLHVNAQLGELELKNVRLKKGTFEHAERLLQKLGVDVWNTWGTAGTPTIFPHAVEIISGTIEKIKVQLPMPNPFNGENWIITVDGTQGVLSTLTPARRQHLLDASRARALQSAERHYSQFRPDRHKDLEAEKLNAMPKLRLLRAPGPVSDNSSTSNQGSKTSSEDGDAQSESSEDVGEGTYMERLQQRIDKYFKKHLAVTIINSKIRLDMADEKEFPHCNWDITVDELSLDLGVGEIHLPESLQNHIWSAHCAFGREVPEEKKPIAEMVGMTWKGIQLAIRGSDRDPAAFVLDFPGRAFELHIVKKQWEEFRRKHTNGFDRIKVTLPDDFNVAVHWDPEVLRAGLLRMLHQIFAGTTAAIPDFTDWLHTPWCGGWDCGGNYVAPEPTSSNTSPTEMPSADRGTAFAKEEGCPTPMPVRTPPSEWVTRLGKQYQRLLSKVNPAEGVMASKEDPERAMDEGSSTALSPSSKKTSETSWASYMWFRSPFCNGCLGPTGPNEEEIDLLTDKEWAWLKELETTISVDWLAYWRRCWRLSVLATDVEEPAAPEDHGPREPSPRWYVAPWRRHEVTLIGNARIGVSLTYGKAREQILHVGVHRGIKAVMVRDQPADWFIWASLPTVRLATDGEEWVTLPHTIATVKWSPTKHMVKEQSSQTLEVPSLCRLKVFSATPTLSIRPGVIAALAPLLCELSCVPSWPELRYFWGEWGYMQRPMAYLVESVSLNGAHISVLNSRQTLPPSPEAAGKSRTSQAMGTEQEQDKGSFETSVGPIVISSGVVYIDSSWQLVGNLQVAVSEVRTLGVREKTTTCVLYLPTLNLRAERLPGVRGTTIRVDVRQLDVLVSVVPLLLILFTFETFYEAFKARSSHFFLVVAQLEKLYYHLLDFTWMWPLSVQVCSPDQSPVTIQISDRVQSLLKVETSFDMQLSFRPDALRAAAREKLLHLAIKPCVVELWYFNMSHVHEWEPVLERWSLAIELAVSAPPQAVVEMSLEGDQTQTLNLNVTPALLRVGRSLAVSWAPFLVPLVKNRIGKLKTLDTQIPMSLLNLSGASVSLKVKQLPQTETEVAMKLQGIWRGKVIRRQMKRGAMVRKVASKTLAKQVSAKTTLTNSELHSYVSARSHVRDASRGAIYRILAAGSLDPCSVTESQRLIVTIVAAQRFPAHSTPSMAEVVRCSQPSLTLQPVRSPLSCCLLSPRRGAPSTSLSLQSKKQFTGPQYLAKVKWDDLPALRDSDPNFDATLLMDLTKHGIKAAWDTDGKTSAPDLPAIVAETISPSQGTRLLVIDSPVRLFNYTDRTLEFCFLCRRQGSDTLVEVSDSLVKGSTFKASVLGSHQPLESDVYIRENCDSSQWVGQSALTVDATANAGCWALPPGCYGSVPPSLRTSDGGVFFSMRCQGTDEWGPVVGVNHLSDNHALFTYKWPRLQEACRVLPCHRVMRESTTVKDAGRPIDRLDFVVMPLFSVANACPVTVQAKLQGPMMEEVLEIGEASVVHFYTLSRGDAGSLVDMSMALRFARPGFMWSKPLHKFYSPFPRKPGTSPRDMSVKICNEHEIAESELVVRCGDVCVVSCPVWLVDKSSLQLQCIDYLQRPFPVVGSHFLLDSTIGDNYLAITRETATSLSATHLVRDSSGESLPDDLKDAVTESSKPFTGSSTNASVSMAMAALPKSVTRRTATMQLTGSGREWPALKAFPLGIKWQAMKPPFGSFLSPPAYLITVLPQIVCSSDSRVQLREQCSMFSEVVLQPNKSMPLWFAQGKGNRMVSVRFDGSSGKSSGAYSAGILLDRTSVGLHSVAIFSKDDEANENAFVFGVMITDELQGTLMVSISTEPALVFRHDAAGIAEAALLTDDPKAGTNKHRTTFGSPAASGALEKLDIPAYAFRCGPGQSVGAGWYQPFSKGAAMDEVSVFLRWERNEDKSIAHRLVCVRVGLYSWKELVILRPKVQVSEFTEEEPCVTGIRLIQEAKQLIVEVFSRRHLEQGAEDSIEIACGSCGERLHCPLPEKVSTVQCTNSECKQELYVPGRVVAVRGGDATPARSASGSNSVVSGVLAPSLMRQLLDAGSWLRYAICKGALQIPNISISICSQREPQPQELVHVSVKGVHIHLTSQLLATRGLAMDVDCVRVDRQFYSERAKSTAVLVSTVVEEEGLTDLAHQPAFHLNILRVFISSPTLCLKNLEVSLKQTFEVDIDTDFVNAMFQFGDECLKATGMEHANSMSEFLDDMRKPATPQQILAKEISHAQKPPNYKLRGSPTAVQTHTFKIGQVNAKVWASLVLFDMHFVPATVARLMTFLTLSNSVNLTAAHVAIEEHDFGMQRTSVAGLAQLTVRTYLPELIRIAATVLGSTNLAKMVVAPVKAVAWAASGAMSLVTAMQYGHHEIDHHAPAGKQSKLKHKSHSFVKASKNAKEPATSELPPIRLPRLLLAKGRLAPYNSVHARLLLAFGTRHGDTPKRLDMSHVLCIMELSQSPLRMVVVCKHSLAICELAGDFLRSESAAWSVSSKRTSLNETPAAIAVGRHFPEGTLWGPWPWDAMSSVGLAQLDDQGAIVRSTSGVRSISGEQRMFEVVLRGARPEYVTWKADHLKDVDLRRIVSLFKCLSCGRSTSGPSL